MNAVSCYVIKIMNTDALTIGFRSLASGFNRATFIQRDTNVMEHFDVFHCTGCTVEWIISWRGQLRDSTRRVRPAL